jgi:hypothetical protein
VNAYIYRVAFPFNGVREGTVADVKFFHLAPLPCPVLLDFAGATQIRPVLPDSSNC